MTTTPNFDNDKDLADYLNGKTINDTVNTDDQQNNNNYNAEEDDKGQYFPNDKKMKEKNQKKQQQEQKNTNDNNKAEKVIYVQKHRDGDQLAEAVIVDGKSYFAVTIPKLGKFGETSVVLQDSITFGGENDSNSTILLKPLEYMSYISK